MPSSPIQRTYRIEIDTHPNLLRLLTELHQIFLGSPFRRLGPLLVKFADIVQVVHVIAVGFLTPAALARWRDPDAVNARCFQAWKCLEKPFPVSLVGWDVPFESLEEASVFRCWFLAWTGWAVRSGWVGLEGGF
jgi:hypothetical protein